MLANAKDMQIPSEAPDSSVITYSAYLGSSVFKNVWEHLRGVSEEGFPTNRRKVTRRSALALIFFSPHNGGHRKEGVVFPVC